MRGYMRPKDKVDLEELEKRPEYSERRKLVVARIIERRAKVAEAMLRGNYRRGEVARSLGVGMQTLLKDEQKICEEWLKLSVRRARYKAEIRVKQLEKAAIEAYEAWERSKEAAEEETERIVPSRCPQCKGAGVDEVSGGWCDSCDGEGTIEVRQVTRTRKGQTGAAAHLENFRRCICEAAKIEGLYPSAVSLNVTSKTDVRVAKIDVSKATPEAILEARKLVLRLKTEAPADEQQGVAALPNEPQEEGLDGDDQQDV